MGRTPLSAKTINAEDKIVSAPLLVLERKYIYESSFLYITVVKLINTKLMQ